MPLNASRVWRPRQKYSFVRREKENLSGRQGRKKKIVSKPGKKNSTSKKSERNVSDEAGKIKAIEGKGKVSKWRVEDLD